MEFLCTRFHDDQVMCGAIIDAQITEQHTYEIQNSQINTVTLLSSVTADFVLLMITGLSQSMREQVFYY